MTSPTPEVLRRLPFFEVFSEEELRRLASLFTQVTYPPGATLIREGDFTTELFFLEKNAVEVFKSERGKEYKLAEIQETELFGEMSFLDREQRSTTIRSQGEVIALRLAREDLESLDKEEGTLKYKFLSNLGSATISKLRKANQVSMGEKDRQHRFGKFVMIMVIAFTLVAIIAGFSRSISERIPDYILSLSMCLFTTGLCYFAIKIIRLPFEAFGFTFLRWKQSLFEGIAISAFLLLSFQLLFPQRNLWGVIQTLFSTGQGWIYILVALMQQIIFRGVLQTALENFYQERLIPVIIASMAFSVSHVAFGPGATVGSFFMGLFLGVLYIRYRDLIGITVVHYTLGTIGMALQLIKI